MPTVLKINGHRFFFFSNEGNEPAHIHIESGSKYAKFWLNPVRLDVSLGYNSKELTQLRKLVEENRNFLEDKWNEYFSS
ncbi:MAG: DUF4160 domain-containing protein [Candidatus Eremiobacterota bacterium]